MPEAIEHAPAPALDAAEPAFAAAGEMVRKQLHGLSYASYFLPKHKRRAVNSVYAFCTMITDALKPGEDSINNGTGLRNHPAVVSPRHLQSAPPTDERVGCGGGEIDTRLAMFRDRLAEIYAGGLELPAVASRSPQQHALEAFSRTVKDFDLPQQYFLDLAEGCRVDGTVMRYATWTRLENYLQLSGGSIGQMIASVLGVTHSEAHHQAAKLGQAVRLAQILRNLSADAQRGRVYLPLEDMVRFRYGEADLLAGTVNERLVELMKFEIARCRSLYEQGAEAIGWLSDEGSRLAVSLIAVATSGVLKAIERQHYNAFASDPKLSTADTMRRLPAAWRLARRQAGEPIDRVFD